MVEAPCLKIEKIQGEKAIVNAKRLGFLNLNLSVQRDLDYIYVPLTKKPHRVELKELRKSIPRFEILQREFLERMQRHPNVMELLNDKLPPNLRSGLPHSLDIVGDIAVVEIPRELEEHKTIIGQAILATNKQLTTVLAKAGAVRGEYRLRKFETIAGIDKTTTVHREHGCLFHVDLAKAYFSPRLSYEHDRVASSVEKGETVLDMFAGVGPFSILIAKKHSDVHVYATEINPEAFKLLKKNMLSNRVATNLEPILGDVRQTSQERLKGTIDRVIMNLPEKAIEYVDVACNVIKPDGGIMHYYELTDTSTPLERAETRLEEVVKQADRSVEKPMRSRIVRGVAPFAWQVVVDARIK